MIYFDTCTPVGLHELLYIIGVCCQNNDDEI